jgi:hypothetical protein
MIKKERRRWEQLLATEKELHAVLERNRILVLGIEEATESLRQEKNNSHRARCTSELRIVELETELKFAKARMQQALDIAENSSGAITSVTRLFGHTSDTLMALEVKLNNENKEARRAE